MAGKVKADRNRRLLEYAEKHPRSSMAAIGRSFRISRQRVWVIIQAAKGDNNGI